MKKQLKLAKEKIDRLLKETANEAAECLLSIPGVGPLTAATALVTMKDVNRFEQADSLIAFWGIYPRRNQSGRQEGRSRMAKNGSKLMKHMLWNAAKSAARCNPACRELFERKVAEGKSKPSAYGAVCRKLVQIMYGVLKSKSLFTYDPQTT